MKNIIRQIFVLIFLIVLLMGTNIVTTHSSPSFAPGGAKYVVTQADPDLTNEVLTTQIPSDLIASGSRNLGSSSALWDNVFGAFGRFTEIISGKVSTENDNQSIYLSPNGTGNVVIGGDSIVVASKSSNPASPRAGQIYLNTATGEFMGYNGISWVSLNTVIPPIPPNTYSLDLEDSSSQYARKGNPSGLPSGSDNRTLEFWVRFESLPVISSEMWLVSYGSQITGGDEFAVTIRNIGGAIKFNADSYGTATYGTVDTGMTTGTWYHIALVYTGFNNTYKYYINGTLVDTIVHTGTNTPSNPVYFTIGGREVYGQYLDGLIDDVRIWNTARTETQIANNMSSQLAGNETGLVGYWRLNNDLRDETTNNDLTNNNSALFSTTVPF